MLRRGLVSSCAKTENQKSRGFYPIGGIKLTSLLLCVVAGDSFSQKDIKNLKVRNRRTSVTQMENTYNKSKWAVNEKNGKTDQRFSPVKVQYNSGAGSSKLKRCRIDLFFLGQKV